MEQIIVHAGMPKCGSSAIQVMLAQNRDDLLKQGFDYFRFGEFDAANLGNITSGNGSRLARSLLNPGHEAYLEDEGKCLDDFIRLIRSSNAQVGLVSSEFFTNIPASSIRELKSKCGSLGITLKYFYCVRRQDQFLMSAYMQRVKRSQSTEYPERFILRNYQNIGFLHYHSFTNNIATILGKENVIVRNYEFSKKHPEGLFGDFLEKIGVDLSCIEAQEQVINISPSPEEIKALIILNKFNPSSRIADAITEDSATFKRSTSCDGHSIVHPSVAREILSFFEEQNAKLETEYLDKECAFDRNVNTNYTDITKLEIPNNTLMEIIGSLLVRFDGRCPIR